MDITSYLLGKKAGGGGDSGTEYEEGTITLLEDTSEPVINFTKNHTTTPICVVFIDTAETPENVNTVYSWNYVDVEKMTGYHTEGKTSTSSNSKMFGYIAMFGQRTETSSGIFTNQITYSSSNTHDDAKYYPRFFVKENYFSPKCNISTTLSSGTYLANHTYKWYAVWK